MSIAQEDIGNKTSVWQIVVDILSKYGSLPVYPPATHKGVCEEPYIVVKEDGATNVIGYSAMYRFFRIMIYVPKNEYSKLDGYEEEVRGILQEKIFPLLLPYGSHESDYYDDNYDAHLRQMVYRNVYREKHI